MLISLFVLLFAAGNVPAVPKDAVDAAETHWRNGPLLPEFASGDKARVVLLSAPWCQWCLVLKATTLRSRSVQEAAHKSFDTFVVDVDRAPLWMDLPGVAGLPAFVFFNRAGEHVLSKSGYRDTIDTLDLFTVVSERLQQGAMVPYRKTAALSFLATSDISSKEAANLRTRFEHELFFLINDAEGGFDSPARNPYPQTLLALEDIGSVTKRVRAWIDTTRDNALRGASPLLLSQPLPGHSYDHALLRRLSQQPYDSVWFNALERLPNVDPYEGLQDPVDHGVFRYAAAAHWLHPHFERRALDNLAWVLLLRAQHRDQQAQQIADFVERTFVQGNKVAAAQQSDAFYYRLPAPKRQGLSPPPVAPLYRLDVQARAARVFPERCQALLRIDFGRWPRALWRGAHEDEQSGDATFDAVGELLVALHDCGLTAQKQQLVVQIWQRWRLGIPESARLFVLAHGLCVAEAQLCGRALATTSGIKVSAKYPPPLRDVDAFLGFGSSQSQRDQPGKE